TLIAERTGNSRCAIPAPAINDNKLMAPLPKWLETGEESSDVGGLITDGDDNAKFHSYSTYSEIIYNSMIIQLIYKFLADSCRRCLIINCLNAK
ncbi:hypothetical protein MNBD_GAMMA14-2412, partial [hydrothermal vent metagenome]